MLDIRHIIGAVLLFVSGLVKLIREYKNFYELEKGIHELCQKVCNQIFTWALAQIDTRLMNERDKTTWEVVGFRPKTAVSTFGEFLFQRRLYKNKKTGETRFFLDELLGWPAGKRLTPRIKELAVKLSAEIPFARAAEILGYLVPGVSAMTVWRATQEVGEILQQEGKEKREAVFAYGEAPAGKEVAFELCLEADGVVIRLQREEEKKGEVKHIVAYEGKEKVAPNRYALKNKLVLGALKDGEAAWEEAYAVIGGKWDLSRTKRIFIGGDGADWPKQGVEYFPGAEYRLDPYHLSRHLTEALWHDEEAFREVSTAISRNDWHQTQKILTTAAKKTGGNRKKRITRLLRYLEENWAGIVTSPGAKRLGTIEGQIQHNVARRMKRLGARWTISGGDRMARILAARANGELASYASRWPVKNESLKKMARVEKNREVKMEDVEEWLRASIPALKGPFADRPWIKYVLRELSRPDFAAFMG